MDLQEIPLDQIKDVPAPKSKARQLSLLELGQCYPIKVRPVDGYYEVIDGRRRVADLREAGVETVQALVEELDDTQAAIHSLTANIARSDNPMSEARDIGCLYAKGYTEKEIAVMLGVTQGLISQRLRLLDLIPALQDRLACGEMTVTAARAAVKLPVCEQKRLARLDMVTVQESEDALARHQADVLGLDDLDIPDSPADYEPAGAYLSGDEMQQLVSGEAITVVWNGLTLAVTRVQHG